jgi:hypothetical protein
MGKDAVMAKKDDGNDPKNQNDGGQGDGGQGDGESGDNGHVSDDDARDLLNIDPKTGKAKGKGDSSEDDDDADDSGKGDQLSESELEAAKWKKLSRKNEADLRKAQAELKKISDANLSEAERTQRDRDEHRTRAEKAETELKRLTIAGETAPEGATLAQLRKVARRMAGDDDDALEADAKELWDDFGPAPVGKANVPSKPKPVLRGGGTPDDSDAGEMDPRKLAALVPRAR